MSNAKILIVEDEKIVAKDIHNQLRRFGYEVTAIVSTGEEAIQKAIETKPVSLPKTPSRLEILVVRGIISHSA
jgi:CheY-like chemotaxis protein